ncbi:AraC family transcriptional regulator [Cellvibrio mixtus]|uniref:AraC family transcriptional regulator n=1 Tax=Cellvibrio mixtus TaxID=39650 RepID=UPI000587D7C0|nr:AraC family transcriptional regulator [Cellvibrio mixtus]
MSFPHSTTHDCYYFPQTWREIDTPFIYAGGWPHSLIELACARGHQEHKLLRNTGIFLQDLAHNTLQFSAAQLFQLIENILKHPAGHELAFLLCHDVFTNNAKLDNAANLHDFLELFAGHSYAISPLLSPHFHYEQERLVIYWQDNFGADLIMPFLLEMIFTALQVYTRRRAGYQLPWAFHVSHNKPAYIEQYQVHLGERVLFNARGNAVSIARTELYRQWHTSDSSIQLAQVSTIGENRHHGITTPVVRGFLHEIYHYLKTNIQHNPHLEKTAQDFGMSSASLKRKLQKHNSSFQQQFDQARKHLALDWLSKEGVTQEEIAQHLHFYDAANLRRAFKRWTGQLPGKL